MWVDGTDGEVLPALQFLTVARGFRGGLGGFCYEAPL